MTRLERIKKAKNHQLNCFLGAVMMGFLAGVILAVTLLRAKREVPAEPIVQEVKAEEPITWNDAIRQIFPADEAGMMIRICMKENGRQNKYAINHNRNGTYDYSWCQVNSVHKPKYMTHDEWKEKLNDPMFNAQQVRKIYLSQGWGAWVVFNKGYVQYGGK
jgi:flagellar basal body-associated protein FliL